MTRRYELAQHAVGEDRAEIIDALYRFGAGQDLRDRELCAAAPLRVR